VTTTLACPLTTAVVKKGTNCDESLDSSKIDLRADFYPEASPKPDGFTLQYKPVDAGFLKTEICLVMSNAAGDSVTKKLGMFEQSTKCEETKCLCEANFLDTDKAADDIPTDETLAYDESSDKDYGNAFLAFWKYKGVTNCHGPVCTLYGDDCTTPTDNDTPVYLDGAAKLKVKETILEDFLP